jgi:hypothetical protein
VKNRRKREAAARGSYNPRAGTTQEAGRDFDEARGAARRTENEVSREKKEDRRKFNLKKRRKHKTEIGHKKAQKGAGKKQKRIKRAQQDCAPTAGGHALG